MISKERLLELSFKSVEIAREIMIDNCKAFDQQRISYNHQQLIVLKKFARMFNTIVDYHISNGDYIEED